MSDSFSLESSTRRAPLFPFLGLMSSLDEEMFFYIDSSPICESYVDNVFFISVKSENDHSIPSQKTSHPVLFSVAFGFQN